MIIFRYLSRQILLSALAVSAVLTVIIVSGRLIKFLTYAAAGELSPEFVLQLVGYRIPGMLVLILPLGLFLGVLLAYGRMYLESEMVVLRASGVSTRKLATLALGPALLVALIVASLSLYFAPLGRQMVEQIYNEQNEVSELDTLTPGRFQNLPGNSRTAYTGTIDSKQKQLDSVFLSERDPVSGKLRVIVAQTGSQVVTNPDTEERFLVLKKGFRYEGVPGQADYQEVEFERYGFVMPKTNAVSRPLRIEAMTLNELAKRSEPKYQSELHWRFSMPLLALIVTLIAVPMSKTNPRQGRYAMLIPSILLYLFYLTLLTSAKGAIDDGKAPIFTLWAIHAAFFLFALSLIFADRFWEKIMNKIPSLPKRGIST